MKVKMLVTPPGGRKEYEKGETYDLDVSYAKKFIARGWAEPADKAAERAAKEAQERSAAEARLKAEQDAKDKADAILAAKLEARSKIVIPGDLSKVADADLVKLGQAVSDEQITTKDQALAAIDAEILRRNS